MTTITTINAGDAVSESRTTINDNFSNLNSGKVEADSPTFTGTVVLPSTTSIGTVSSTEISYLDGVTSAIQTQIDTKAPTASPTFTGTVSGITSTMVGLGNVTNTSDANKPVSTAQQTALDLKANLASPTFTGTVVLPSTTSIGTVSNTEIGYLDGVTSALQTQIDLKSPLASPSFTGTPTAPTATLGTNTTQIATTEFVIANAGSGTAQNSNEIKGYQALGSSIKAESLGVDAQRITSGFALTDGIAVFQAVYLDLASTITGVKCSISTSGVYTPDNNNYVALYSYSGGTLTQVAISTNNGTQWSGGTGVTTIAFSSPYSASAGMYYVGFLYNTSSQTTAPQLHAASLTVNAMATLDFTNSAKITGTISSQTSLPASQAMSGLSTTGNKIWFMLY